MLVTDEKGLSKRLDELNENLKQVCNSIDASSDRICRALLCVAASGEYEAVKNTFEPSESLRTLMEFFFGNMTSDNENKENE